MLRIEQVAAEPGGWTLRLEGSLAGPWVEELKRSCEPALDARRPLTLDLGAVSFVDGNGVALLKSLKTRAVRLSNSSAFVAGLLEMEEQ